MATNDDALPAPFDDYRTVVRPEWIDHNGHMNMGYYMVVCDFATDAWFEHVGIGRAYRTTQRVTTFCLEAHMIYHREVREGDPLRFATHLLEFDAKRLHYVHEMYHAGDGYLAATNELLSLCVSEETRRATAMTGDVLARLERLKVAHGALSRRPQVGRRIGLAARPTTR